MSSKGGPPRVLGNDPFKRAAAPSKAAPQPQKPGSPPQKAVPQPEKPLAEAIAEKISKEPAASPVPPRAKPVMTPVKPPEPKRVAPKPPPPPKIVVPKPKAGDGTPARRAVTSFASAPPPAPEPKVTAPERPSQRLPKVEVKPSPSAPAAPAATQADVPKAPMPPPPPDGAVRRATQAAVVKPMPPPPAGDTAPALPRSSFPTPIPSPVAHAGSPTIGADPIAHSFSPEARHAPQSHEGSPELRAEFTAHETSPEVIEELEEGRATPHSGSPAVVAELKEREAIPHGHSPEVVSDRVRDVGLALEAAKEVGEGLARPLIAAASGLAKAAKTALGLGSVGAVDTWGKDESLTRALHPVGDFLYDKYFRVTVEGAELIPSGPSILVANHSGALPLDGPMLHYALQRERSDLSGARWLVEDQVFHAPVLGVLVNRLGAVRAHPDNAVKLLEEGRPVIVFPEGFLGISKPFTQRYQLKRFGRGGYVKLALKQHVPIVPVAIVGAEESMPLLAKLPGGMLGLPYLPLTPPPLPARWRIRFSDPIVVNGSAEDLAYVQEQNDLVRDTIAGMLTAMLGS